jgi:cardiolipin synthase (CMP-forming)
MSGPTSSPVPRWLPNAISAFRVLLVPVWLVFAEQMRTAAIAGQPGSATPLLVILLVLGFSDMLDGWVARRFGLTSPLGATLDAVADKLAQVAFVTYLAWRAIPGLWPLPIWFWCVILGRDVVIALGFWVLKRRLGNVETEHEVHGKVASVLLFFVVLGVCGNAPHTLLFTTTVLTSIIVVISTIDYGRRGLAALRRPPEAP